MEPKTAAPRAKRRRAHQAPAGDQHAEEVGSISPAPDPKPAGAGAPGSHGQAPPAGAVGGGGGEGGADDINALPGDQQAEATGGPDPKPAAAGGAGSGGEEPPAEAAGGGEDGVDHINTLPDAVIEAISPSSPPRTPAVPEP